jgi:hypothetical protein
MIAGDAIFVRQSGWRQRRAAVKRSKIEESTSLSKIDAV